VKLVAERIRVEGHWDGRRLRVATECAQAERRRSSDTVCFSSRPRVGVKMGNGAAGAFYGHNRRWKGLWSRQGSSGPACRSVRGVGCATVVELRPKRGKCATKKQHVKQCAGAVQCFQGVRTEWNPVVAIQHRTAPRRPAAGKEILVFGSSPRHYYRTRRMPRSLHFGQSS
jgi:hypothetical protein